MFPTQGLNPLLLPLLPWQADSLPLRHLGSWSSFLPIRKLQSVSKFATSEFIFSWKHLPSALLPLSAVNPHLGFFLWSSPSLQFLVLSDLLTSCCLVPVWPHHRKFVTNILHDWIQWWFLRLHSWAPAAFHCGVTLVISARTLEVNTLQYSLFLGLSGLHWLSRPITTSNSFILDFSVVQCWRLQASNAGGASLILAQGTGSHMLHGAATHTKKISHLNLDPRKGNGPLLEDSDCIFRKVKSSTVPGTQYLLWTEAP